MALRGAVEVAPRPFAELVFHVLAHVPGEAAPSVWDPIYVAWCAERLGPARERALAEDARALAAMLRAHEGLVDANRLAWRFTDLEEARPKLACALNELGIPASDALELLWCAIGLEEPAFSALPPVKLDGVADAIAAMADVAPAILTYRIGVVRSLRLRGRVRGDEIWIGSPELTTPERIGWQAAHEATVAEVAERERLPFVELERRALELLRERAARARRTESHARWLSSLRVD